MVGGKRDEDAWDCTCECVCFGDRREETGGGNIDSGGSSAMTTGSARGPARETGEGTTGLGCGTLAESVSNDMLSSGTDAPADWLRITEAWRKLVDDSANAEYRLDLPLDAEEDLLAAVLVRRLGGGVGVLDSAV